MYRIAISGHRGLPAPTVSLVDQALRAALAEHAPDVTGLSCLADGADQIFARAVTDLGGTLEAVIPAAEYREKLPAESHRGYDDLFARAAAVRGATGEDSEGADEAEEDALHGGDAPEVRERLRLRGGRHTAVRDVAKKTDGR